MPENDSIINFFDKLFNTDFTGNIVLYITVVIVLSFLLSSVLYIIYSIFNNLVIQAKISHFSHEWNTNGVQQLAIKKQKYLDLISKKDALLSDEAIEVLSLLPPKYIYLDAINYFIEVIVNMRADTIKEAVNLYEEHLHRLRMEAAQERIAAQQSQLLQLQQENQTILNSIGDSMRSIDYSTKNISSDVERLTYLATLEYLRK